MNIYGTNKVKIFYLFPLVLLFSCASPESDQFPEFQTSREEILQAKADFRRSDKNFLSLLMVNRDGAVVKVKKLASKLGDARKNVTVTKAMYDVEFKKASEQEALFREFILPYKVGGVGNNDSTETTLRSYNPRDYIEADEW